MRVPLPPKPAADNVRLPCRSRRFFNGLTTEPAGVRAAVQEAVSSLGGAFKGCQGGQGLF